MVIIEIRNKAEELVYIAFATDMEYAEEWLSTECLHVWKARFYYRLWAPPTSTPYWDTTYYNAQGSKSTEARCIDMIAKDRCI